MLSDMWRDILNLVGLTFTAAGLLYAIIQVQRTRSAAVAAEEAAKKVLTESRDRFSTYLVSTAFRLVREVQIHLQRIEGTEWATIALRLEDLAEQTALLAPLDPEWQQTAQDLREWAAAAATQSRYKMTKFDRAN